MPQKKVVRSEYVEMLTEAATPPATTYYILLENGTDRVLLENGSDKVLTEGAP